MLGNSLASSERHSDCSHLRLWELNVEWLHCRAAYFCTCLCQIYCLCDPQRRLWPFALPRYNLTCRGGFTHSRLKLVWTGASAPCNNHECEMEVSSLSSYLAAGSWADRSPLHDAASQGRLLALRTLILQVTEHNPRREQRAHEGFYSIAP